MFLLRLQHRSCPNVIGSIIVVQNKGGVTRSAGIIGAIEMEIGCQDEKHTRRKGMRPVKADQVIALEVQIRDSGFLLLRRVRNLVMAAAQRSDPAELIVSSRVV